MDDFDFVNLSSTFGLIATGFFTANLLLGVLLSTQYQRTLTWQKLPRFIRSISLYQVHNYTAYIALLTAFTHPVLLLFDKKAGFSVLNIAVPLTAPHQNYIYSLGALAFYGLLTAVVTSTVFVRKLFSNRTWKLIHFVSYGAAMLFLIHGVWADPLLLDRPVDFLDAEKVLSEAGIVLLIAALIFRFRYAKQKRESETFYPLKVSKIIKETDLANSFVLEVPEHLKKQFKYKPGQFTTLRVQDGESFIKRSYSMTSAPETDSFLRITIKRLGQTSNFLLDTVKEGDNLTVLPPEGSFFRKPTTKPTHYLFFAAGSGITPFLSMTKSLLKTRQDSRITLVYANLNEGSVIFKNELDKFEQDFSEKFSVIHVLEKPSNLWTGRKGMLMPDSLNELIDELLKNSLENKEYYICGAVGYINLVENVLLERNVSAEKIHAEKYTFAPDVNVLNGDETPQKILRVGDAVRSNNGRPQKLTIQLKGEVREIDYQQGESVLDAALRAGLFPPFACQEGVCASCKATVKSGCVVMLKHEALTPLEADQQNILTCTAAAISENTVISFDES
jgi:ring-1,2-phenylacetyl-CoA epoxidase subunit PaaE